MPCVVTLFAGKLRNFNRVAKGTIGSVSCDLSSNGFSITNAYIVGLNGEQVSETNGAGQWYHTNVFAKRQLLATYGASETYFALNDWLGTKRAEVTPDGDLTTFASLPFGNDLTTATIVGNQPDATEQHFTGKERDQESGNDYFGARYYASTTGRFLSPDWSAKVEPVPYAKLDNPQSLNLYDYMLNNPLGGVDADGHQVNPTRQQVISELNHLAKQYGIPSDVVRATARTESGFNIHEVNNNVNAKGNITSTDYGVMQVNSKNIGGSVKGPGGKTFTISASIKTDWKANAKAGTAILAQGYKAAVKEQPNGTAETRAEQAYSAYNAGPGGRNRYMQKNSNGGFADARDAHFDKNYQAEHTRKP